MRLLLPWPLLLQSLRAQKQHLCCGLGHLAVLMLILRCLRSWMGLSLPSREEVRVMSR